MTQVGGCVIIDDYSKLEMKLRIFQTQFINLRRGGSRAAATFKMERLLIIVNGFRPLTVITKLSILDVAATLDPSLLTWEKPSTLSHKYVSQQNNIK